MRIVVWNLQGRKVTDIGDAKKLVAQFEEKVHCDMLIVLEAPEGMNFVPGGKYGRAVITMTFHEFLPGASPAFRGDHIAIFSKVAFTTAVLSLPNADVYAYVITLTDSGTKLVTFHAPYVQNQGAAPAFVNEVFKAMRAQANRPSFAIGDFNTYGNTVPDGYECKLASPTSSRGKGSPLDKVATRVGYPITACGRIYDRSMSVGEANKEGTLSQTEDLVTDGFEKLEIPDHLAIYIDIATDAPLNPPAAAVLPAVIHEPFAGVDDDDLKQRLDTMRRANRKAGGTLEAQDARRHRDLESEWKRRQNKRGRERDRYDEEGKEPDRDASPVRK